MQAVQLFHRPSQRQLRSPQQRNSVPQQIQGDSVQPEFILRTQSDRANSYGVGEIVVPNVVLFRSGEYDLTLAEAKNLLARKVTPKKAH